MAFSFARSSGRIGDVARRGGRRIHGKYAFPFNAFRPNLHRASIRAPYEVQGYRPVHRKRSDHGFKGNTPTQGRQGIGTEDSVVRKPKHLYKAAYVPPALLQTALELDDLDRLISPLLKQGQPLNHIYATHENEIGCSRRSIYHYLEQGAFSAGPLDLPRKVRYKPRKVRKHIEKPTPSYRVERTYKDFERYMESHHEANVVEMDTVEGSKGGPVLLTMLFRSCNFMLIFLLARNTQADVCEIFEAIETVLGTEKMQELFEVVLTDNGAEFKNPSLLERSLSGQRRTHIFYCDPMASWQKGRLERNHEFIRYILPKGCPFTSLTKAQVITMMNHINNTARASLNGRTPFELASLLLPETLLRWAGAVAVPHDDVLLKPHLLKMVSLP